MRKRTVAIALILASGLLTGCAPATPEERAAEKQADMEYSASKSRLITEVDGCRIWEIYNPSGENPFLARCPEGAADTFEEHMFNKVTKKTFTIGGK